MTITFRNVPAQIGAKNAAITVASMTPLFVNTTESANGLIQTTEYALTLNPANDTRVFIRSEYQPNVDKTRNSIRVVTDVVDDALDDPESAGPYEVVIAWNHPGKFALDTAQLGRLLQVATGLVFYNDFNATSGLPGVTLLNQVALGITKIW